MPSAMPYENKGREGYKVCNFLRPLWITPNETIRINLCGHTQQYVPCFALYATLTLHLDFTIILLLPRSAFIVPLSCPFELLSYPTLASLYPALPFLCYINFTLPVPYQTHNLPSITFCIPPTLHNRFHCDPCCRYIEGLASGSRSVGDWDKTLTAVPPEAPPASLNPKLPAHWLGNGPGHHENVTSALWALRDLMLRDALAISRSVKT